MDCVLTNPGSPIPSYDSSDVVRSHRVITCVNQGSRMFLVERIAKISEVWNGLTLKLIPARVIPRRLRARIWLPNGQSDYEKIVRTLRVMNP